MKWEWENVIIYPQDYASLDQHQWITDTVIEFWYEWLEQENQWGYLRPALVHWLAHAVMDGSFVPPEKTLDRSLVFIPINDNEDDAPGGTHWSLAVFHRSSLSFYYYDSLGDYNLNTAKRTCKRLASWLVKGDVGKMNCNALTSIEPFFVPVETPKQINGYDCGVYVMAITELLSKRFCDLDLNMTGKPGDLSLWKCSHLLPPEKITAKRMDIQSLIKTVGKPLQ